MDFSKEESDRFGSFVLIPFRASDGNLMLSFLGNVPTLLHRVFVRKSMLMQGLSKIPVVKYLEPDSGSRWAAYVR